MHFCFQYYLMKLYGKLIDIPKYLKLEEIYRKTVYVTFKIKKVPLSLSRAHFLENRTSCVQLCMLLIKNPCF